MANAWSARPLRQIDSSDAVGADHLNPVTFAQNLCRVRNIGKFVANRMSLCNSNTTFDCIPPFFCPDE